MIKISDRLNGVGEYYFSQKLREIDSLNREGRKVINLGIGSPDLPPHPDVIRVLQEASARPDVHGYQSYRGSPVLRTAISKWYLRWYGVELDPTSEILPLMGSKEGIMHICMTYLDKGDLALVPDPGYPTYRSAVQLAGGECLAYELNQAGGWYPDLRHLEQRDPGRVKLMFLNYPQMPTGAPPSAARFRELVDFAIENRILLVHDNPYSFILNEKPQSILAVPGAKKCAIELNSLSKSHNMAGWRVGMLCGQGERIEEVLRFKSNMDSGMYLPVQLAAARALELDSNWFDELNTIYTQRREEIFNLLRHLDCTYSTRQSGLFVWAGIPRSFKNAYAWSDYLLHEAGVFITPGGIFGRAGEGYIRASLCNPVELIKEAKERVENNINIQAWKEKT